VNSEPQLLREGGGAYYLRGSVDFHSVSDLANEDVLDESAEVSIDLGGLQSVDSSAVALLIQWQRQAAQKGIPLRFLNIPDQLKPLITLYDLEDII